MVNALGALAATIKNLRQGWGPIFDPSKPTFLEQAVGTRQFQVAAPPVQAPSQSLGPAIAPVPQMTAAQLPIQQSPRSNGFSLIGYGR
jgi:hypothetical protein